MMKELGLSPREFGVVAGSFFLLFSVSGMLTGVFVVRRMKAKWILLVLAGIWSIVQLPLVFSTSIVVIVASRIVLGAGEGPATGMAFHVCYQWFENGKRNLPSSLIITGITFGFMIGSPSLSYFVIHYGWRSGFVLCALLGAAWMVAWAIFGEDGPLAAPVPVRGAETAAAGLADMLPARILWLDPTMVGVLALAFTSYWVIGMSATWLPPYLQAGLGYSQYATGWIISGIYALQVPLIVGGSWLADWLFARGWGGRACWGHGSTIAIVISGAALVAAAQFDLGTVRLVLLSIGFTLPSLVTVLASSALAAVAPPVQRGGAIVVTIAASALAGLMSTYVTGWIIGAASVAAVGYATAFTLAGAILIGGAVVSAATIFPDRTISRFAMLRSRPRLSGDGRGAQPSLR